MDDFCRRLAGIGPAGGGPGADSDHHDVHDFHDRGAHVDDSASCGNIDDYCWNHSDDHGARVVDHGCSQLTCCCHLDNHYPRGTGPGRHSVRGDTFHSNGLAANRVASARSDHCTRCGPGEPGRAPEAPIGPVLVQRRLTTAVRVVGPAAGDPFDRRRDTWLTGWRRTRGGLAGLPR